ncbi:hypothetical protein HDU96_008083 [Phlyctochytrium bullatum]|nr:hypothetical protein HDU96_008083 [Phlyctochytrium bullatum]
MLRPFLTSFALLSALIPSALGKLCRYHYNHYAKSIFVWDNPVQDDLMCNYWNWHYNNLPTFTQVIPFIIAICSKWDNEMGFMLVSSNANAPDRLLMPDGGECESYPDEMAVLLTTTGWDCRSLPQLKDWCSDIVPIQGL